MFRKLSSVIVTTACLSALAIQLGAVENNNDKRWVATWSAAMHAPGLGPPGFTNEGFDHRTLRQIVHTSVGGDKVRIRFSAFGAGALDIAAARVALWDSGAAIVPDSDRQLTFGGLTTIRIPAGAIAVSDPVDLAVPALSKLAVSMFVPGPKVPATWHFVAQQTSYISPPGDFTTAVDMPAESTTDAWFWLAGADVLVPKQTGAIVAFGDSVTDGVGSKPNENTRWPDYLAGRLMARPGNHQMGVVNQGLTGNRLLRDILGPNGPSRFDRDVLTQPGVTHVIVLLGNNDIIRAQRVPAEAVTTEEMIQAHQMLIARAHLRGLKIYGATLTPFRGALDELLFPAAEAQRQAVNHWIRTSGEYDAVLDFDLAIRWEADPAQLDPDLRADALHPNDAGYAAMARAIDLELFKPKADVFLNTHFREGAPDFSPDGRWLAYDSDESGRHEVYVRPVGRDGRKHQISTEGGRRARWSRDGRQLFYINSNDDALLSARISFSGDKLSVDATSVRARFPYFGGAVANYGTFPDGRILMIRQEPNTVVIDRLIVIQDWLSKITRPAAVR